MRQNARQTKNNRITRAHQDIKRAHDALVMQMNHDVLVRDVRAQQGHWIGAVPPPRLRGESMHGHHLVPETLSSAASMYDATRIGFGSSAFGGIGAARSNQADFRKETPMVLPPMGNGPIRLPINRFGAHSSLY